VPHSVHVTAKPVQALTMLGMFAEFKTMGS